MLNENYPDKPWIEPVTLASAMILAYSCVGSYLGSFRTIAECRTAGARFINTTSDVWLDLQRPIVHFPGFAIVEPVVERDQERRLTQTLSN